MKQRSRTHSSVPRTSATAPATEGTRPELKGILLRHKQSSLVSRPRQVRTQIWCSIPMLSTRDPGQEVKGRVRHEDTVGNARKRWYASEGGPNDKLVDDGTTWGCPIRQGSNQTGGKADEKECPGCRRKVVVRRGSMGIGWWNTWAVWKGVCCNKGNKRPESYKDTVLGHP